MASRGRAGEFRIDPQKLKVAVRRLDEQLEKARENASQLQDRDHKYDELRGVLESLPEKVTHPVMVPFGPLAFFEGHFEHTNEVLVQLSSDWFALKTAKHALGTVGRRKERLQREMDEIEQEVEELEKRRRLAVDEGAALGVHIGGRPEDKQDGVLDIREPYEDDHERAQGSGVSGATVTRDADGYLDIREPLDPEEITQDSCVDMGGTLAATLRTESSLSDGASSGGVDMARLRELERLEAEEDLNELDELLESYENTGKPPAGFASASDVLGEPPPAAASGSAGTSALVGDIRSPADIYELMSNAAPAPASALPRKLGSLEPSLQQAAFTPPLRQPAENTPGVSGEVRERAVASAEEHAAGSAGAPKRLSKFKAERQRAGR